MSRSHSTPGALESGLPTLKRPFRDIRLALRGQSPASPPPAPPPRSLLPFVGLDGFLDLFLNGLDVEARRRLHRRKIDRRLRELTHRFLHENEAPELARHEIVHVASSEIVHVFAADRWCPLERILTDINNGWHVGRDLLPWPALRLLEESEFEVIKPQRAKMWATEVKEFMTGGRPLAQQNIQLIVAVEMVLVCPAL